MYGPLVMAGTGAQTWNQATLNIDSRLSNITVGESNGVTTGAGANLLTLKLGARNSSQTIIATPTVPTTTAST